MKEKLLNGFIVQVKFNSNSSVCLSSAQSLHDRSSGLSIQPFTQTQPQRRIISDCLPEVKGAPLIFSVLCCPLPLEHGVLPSSSSDGRTRLHLAAYAAEFLMWALGVQAALQAAAVPFYGTRPSGVPSFLVNHKRTECAADAGV